MKDLLKKYLNKNIRISEEKDSKGKECTLFVIIENYFGVSIKIQGNKREMYYSYGRIFNISKHQNQTKSLIIVFIK